MVRLNVALLRRGLAIGSQHLLSVAGRSSGVVRTTPVSLASVDGERYIVAAFANANWVKNVRAAGEATLTWQGIDERVRLVELPVGEREPMLRAFLTQVRGGVRFFGGRSDEEIVASAERYPVFRIESH